MLTRLILLPLVFALLVSALVFTHSQAQQAKEETARAQELLSQARAALGGEKFIKIQGFTAQGKFRRTLGDRQMDGDLEINCLLPDKLLKEETFSPLPGAEIISVEGLNSDTAWMDAHSSGGGPGLVLRVGNGRTPTPEEAARREGAVRANLVRTMFSFLLNTPSTFPLEYAYAGVAEAPDGSADVLDVTGPNNFALRLYLDQKTHRPLMVSYRDRAARMVMRTEQGGGPPPNPEEMEKRAQEMQAQAAKAPLNEIQIMLDDYRSVDGVMLPHRLAKSVDGKVEEEWEIAKFKVNPSLKPEKFKK